MAFLALKAGVGMVMRAMAGGGGRVRGGTEFSSAQQQLCNSAVVEFFTPQLSDTTNTRCVREIILWVAEQSAFGGDGTKRYETGSRVKSNQIGDVWAFDSRIQGSNFDFVRIALAAHRQSKAVHKVTVHGCGR